MKLYQNFLTKNETLAVKKTPTFCTFQNFHPDPGNS